MSENIYKYNNEEIKYNIKSYVNMSDRIKIIKDTARLCIIDDDYFSCLEDIAFDIALINVLTDIDLGDMSIDDTDNFIKNTNVIDSIKSAIGENFIEKLRQETSYNIEYKTGIHEDSVSKSISNFFKILNEKIYFDQVKANTILEKLNTLNLENLDINAVVDAYVKSEEFKSNKSDLINSKNEEIRNLTEKINKLVNDYQNQHLKVLN
jgi:hypothetical protein